jgi:mycothiol system anti-sigma-R factor
MATQCSDISSLTQTYLDGELTDRDLHDFEHHIAACAECEQLVNAERGFHRLVRSQLAPPRAPELLRRRVQLALDGEDASRQLTARRARWGWALPSASLAAAAAALIVFASDVVSPVHDRSPMAIVETAPAFRSSANPVPVRSAAGLPLTPVIEFSDVVEFSDVEGRTRGGEARIDERTVARAAAKFIGVPVELPGFDALSVTLLSLQPTMVGDRRAALLVYDVETSTARQLMGLYVLDGRGLPAAGGERRVIAGHDALVVEIFGLPAVIYKNSRGIAYMFIADMREDALIDVVANSGLIVD